MEFQTQAAIWLQIAHQIASRIMAGEWPPGDRIPSGRALGADLQVNPNTVVANDGVQKALDMRKKAFTEDLLPPFFRMMDELGMDWNELQHIYQNLKNKL